MKIFEEIMAKKGEMPREKISPSASQEGETGTQHALDTAKGAMFHCALRGFVSNSKRCAAISVRSEKGKVSSVLDHMRTLQDWLLYECIGFQDKSLTDHINGHEETR